jgi:hypothetical protein
MNESKSQIAQGSPDLRSGPGAKMRAITGYGHIADVMRAVLDGSMSPHHVEQTLR